MQATAGFGEADIELYSEVLRLQTKVRSVA
jgi:hypothetical protein